MRRSFRTLRLCAIPGVSPRATLLHLLGLDHKRLTFRFQGRDFRLTDIHGELLHKLMT